MNILAVESSTQACSVSLLMNEQVVSRFELAPQRHANLMLPMVEAVMAESKLEGSNIDFLAFSEGPGAFTGIRIATGVIQGLALGWNKPVIAVSTLEALAWEGMQQLRVGKILACIDARMKEIYAQECWLEQGILKSRPVEMMSETQLEMKVQTLVSLSGGGDIHNEYPHLSELFVSWLPLYPSAEAVVRLAKQQIAKAHTLKDAIPMPVYLRNNIAEKTVDRVKRQLF